jgi:hypothetical protein
MNPVKKVINTVAGGLLATVLLTLVAGCASRGDIAGDSTTAMSRVGHETTEIPVEGEDDPSKKLICRRIKPTGSRFGERVCMRAAQWEKYSGHGRKGVEDVQSKALTTNDQGG